ncbi:MAG: S1C family serine protease [Bacillota bacterium]
MSPFFDDHNRQGVSQLSYLLVALVSAVIGGLLVAFLLPGLLPQSNQQNLETRSTPQQLEDSSLSAAGNSSVVEVVDKVGPAIVKITTVEKRLTYDFFYGRRQEEVTGEGSGVIFDQAGYILTNNHVVAGADQIKVILTMDEQQRKFKGKVVGRDPITDLAVVKINGEDLPTAQLGNSNQLQVGEEVVAIGNPFGFSNTVTTGVVSAVDRKLEIQKGTELTDMIQTDAAINPGNSGGALLNKAGKVIGINTAIIQGAQGIGFAIPINTAQDIAKELIAEGRVIRPWLGIYGITINESLAHEYNLARNKGIFVAEVVSGSPAAKADLKRGDIIAEIEGQEINSMSQLRDKLKEYQVDEQIKLAFYRDRSLKVSKIKLDARPQPN